MTTVHVKVIGKDGREGETYITKTGVAFEIERVTSKCVHAILKKVKIQLPLDYPLYYVKEGNRSGNEEGMLDEVLKEKIGIEPIITREVEMSEVEVKQEASEVAAAPVEVKEKKERKPRTPKTPGGSIYPYTKMMVEQMTANDKKPKLEEIAVAVQQKFPEAGAANIMVMANSCRAAVERAIGRPVVFDKPPRKPRTKKEKPESTTTE